MRVIIACAGTGGHINPGISIANYIKKKEPDSDIIFIGSKGGLENTLVPKAGYNIVNIRAGRLYRKITLKNITNIKNAYLGVKDAKKIIKDYNPDIVIGTGGFICIPAMKAAKALKIPYVLHESNAFPGLAIKLTSSHAAKVFVGFKETQQRLNSKNIVFTGTPTKFNTDNILKLDIKQCKKDLGLDIKTKNKRIIFVTGGSQGAKKFNHVVINMIEKYKSDKFFVVIATGLKNYDEIKQSIAGKNLDDFLKVIDYVYDIDKMYKVSDLLIARAGALTITEISIVEKPSILIPLPYAAENHQLYNAQVLENNNASIVIEETVLNEDILYDTIISVITDENKLKEMSKNASKLYIPNVEERIYKEIIQIIRGK